MTPSTHPIPKSYTTLTLPQIKLNNVPPDALEPTPIILLTLHRPEHKNAFTDTMRDSLVTAFGILGRDERVKCIVVTGYGHSFCVGADLEVGFGAGQTAMEKRDGRELGREYREENKDGGGKVTLAILGCNKPVIGALNGHAIGVGITITLGMTIRIVSSKAKVGFVFARRGIVMEGASSYFLPRLLGLSKAMHLVTTGAVYPASHPLMEGLFSEVVEEGKVLGRALEVAEEVVGGCSVVSWGLMRDMMVRGGRSPEEAVELESRVLFEVYRGEDCKEGVESFLEKRDARFTGTMGKDAPGIWPWWKEGGELGDDGGRKRGSKL